MSKSKKIFIGISILIIIILLSVVGIFVYQSNGIVEGKRIVNLMLEDTIVDSNQIAHIQINNDFQESVIEDAEVAKSSENDEKQQINQKDSIQSVTKKENNKNVSQDKDIANNNIQKSTQTTQSIQQTQPMQTEKQDIQTNQNQTNTTPQNQTKYVRNDAMIQKIKSVIENNVTDDMRNYGYTIVVDSSIKERTNQFTFTENRVKNNIRYSFGTIRIYAEDYYSNGQLIMTECYIL